MDRNEKIKTYILILLIALGIALDLQALIDLSHEEQKRRETLRANG